MSGASAVRQPVGVAEERRPAATRIALAGLHKDGVRGLAGGLGRSDEDAHAPPSTGASRAIAAAAASVPSGAPSNTSERPKKPWIMPS